MLNLVGRNLKFFVLKTTSVHRLFPRLSSSSPADNSFAVSYLMNSCRFTREKAILVAGYLNLKTPDRADSVIAFFKNQGFTDTQIYFMIQCYPTALKCHPQNNFLPKFDFFRSIGLSDSAVIKLFTTHPSLLGGSLKKYILPTYNLLGDPLQSSDTTLNTIRRHFSEYVGEDCQPTLAANIQLLQEIGVPRSNMLVYLLTHQDEDLEYLVVSTKLFKKAVEKVVEMGFNPLKTNRLLSAVSVIMSLGESTWEKRVEFYEKWGWSKSQILQVFRTKPWFMMESEEEIDKVMDYLVNKMGFQTSLIAKNPGLLLLSMEKRIVPRCLVYQYCVDNGLMKDEMFCGFCWWLKCSQDIFVERLKRYETKAPGVLKFYQEKLDHARIKDGNLFQLSIW